MEQCFASQRGQDVAHDSLVPNHPGHVSRVALLFCVAIDFDGDLLILRLLNAKEQIF
jgi:hypothetical protein